MGWKLGGSAPFWGGGAGSPSNTMSLGPRPTSLPSGILIHQAIWPQQIWAENWGLCPFGGGESGSSSNTMWPGPRPTYMPSFILIRSIVWPPYTNVTDRTDNGLIAWDEPFYKWSPKNCFTSKLSNKSVVKRLQNNPTNPPHLKRVERVLSMQWRSRPLAAWCGGQICRPIVLGFGKWIACLQPRVLMLK